MSDVHYYLDGWTPRNVKDEDWYTCIGANFHHMPGKYMLPFNEGYYSIDGDAIVHMKPRKSPRFYTHPLVILENTNMEMEFGWYRLVAANGKSRSFSVRKAIPTGFNTGCSL